MQIFDTIQKTEYELSVALGFFDGIHLGHRVVIGKCKENADDKLKTAVFTFKNSPSDMFSDNKKPMLTTNEEKFELLETLGVDIVYCIDFAEIMELTAKEFVQQILFEKLNTKCAVTGFNYHFGKGGTATADDLKTMCDELNIKTIKCPPQMFDGDNISSTRIRACILNGEVEKANAMLSYDFSINSPVTSGNHIGTKLNSPTINQKLSDKLIVPRFGVYATKVIIDDKTYFGATNIGTHPTVGESEPLCETHLLNFDGKSLYGKYAKTSLLKFIRPEKKFASLDELKNQIEIDKSQIEAFFKI